MKTETLLLVLGTAAAIGGGYYFLVYKPKQLAAATPAAGQAAQTAQLPPTVPQGSIPQLGTPGTGASSGVPPMNVSAMTKAVTLTTSFQAQDLSTGLMRTFNPGDQVLVYAPGLYNYGVGVTTFSDVSAQPHLYTTQSVVAGNLVGAGRGGGAAAAPMRSSSAYGSSAYGAPPVAPRGIPNLIRSGPGNNKQQIPNFIRPGGGAAQVAPMYDRPSRTTSMTEYLADRPQPRFATAMPGGQIVSG
ncbi:MAG: hypothetical protein ACYDH4_10675 [Candidatus Cryosericum sp.]